MKSRDKMDGELEIQQGKNLADAAKVTHARDPESRRPAPCEEDHTDTEKSLLGRWCAAFHLELPHRREQRYGTYWHNNF